MIDKVIIRDAYAPDMTAVYRLINELAIYENAPKEVTNSVEQLIEDGFGSNPVFKSIVAVVDDQVIGFALFYVSYSTWKGKCLYLEDFLVTAEYRRQGIGKLLFDHVFTIATQGGYKRFHWQVLDWNQPAIDFYQKYKTEFDETWVNCRLVLST